MVDEFYTSKEVNYDPKELRQENDFFVYDYKLVAFNGAEYNIQHLVIETVIYEDLFSNCISGSITIAESIDIPQLYPLIGEERIKLKFTRPDVIVAGEDKKAGAAFVDEDYELNARIIEIDNRKRLGENKQFYVLSFVSEEYIKACKNKVQKSFKDKRYSEMVEIIFGEKLAGRKPLQVEATKYHFDYVVPNFSPTEAINFFGAMSLSDEGNGSYYVFYEDKRQFNYTSIGKLIKGPVAAEYGHTVKNVFKHTGLESNNRDMEKDMISTDYFSLHGGFNVTENLQAGMYASKLLTVDPTRKIYEEYDFDYKAKFASLPHLAENDICTDKLDCLGNPEAVFCMEFTNKDHDIISWIGGKEPGINPWHIDEWLQLRMSQYQQMENHKVFCQIPGDPRRTVGQVINFEMPGSPGDTSQERPLEPDKYLSGKYLITACKHVLTTKEYVVQLELVKDSFVEKIEHVDIIERYKDIW